MVPIQWRPEAQADLETILAYIAERNQQAAFDLLDEIDRAVSQLPKHPNLYRPDRVAGTREMVVHRNYLLVYRMTSTTIEILSVVHARRRYP
jgi:toxin ParE1/3/4